MSRASRSVLLRLDRMPSAKQTLDNLLKPWRRRINSLNVFSKEQTSAHRLVITCEKSKGDKSLR
jgi:hypothetical protein